MGWRILSDDHVSDILLEVVEIDLLRMRSPVGIAV